jgi:hypothetical protein
VCAPAGTGGEWRWSQVAPAGCVAPSDRILHGATAWGGDTMVLFGGAALEPGCGELSDVWLLRKERGDWAWSAPARHTPYVRWVYRCGWGWKGSLSFVGRHDVCVGELTYVWGPRIISAWEQERQPQPSPPPRQAGQ